MFYLLVGLLFICLVIAYYLNEKSIIAPSFLYSFSFFFCSIFALLNKNRWDFILATSTFKVISLSVVEFIIAAYLVSKICSVFQNSHRVSRNKIITDIHRPQKTELLKIDYFKMYIIIIIQVVNILFLWHSLMVATGRSLLAAMTFFNSNSISGDAMINLNIPKLLTYTSTFNIGTAILAEYLLAEYLVKYKKTKFSLLLMTLLGFVTSFSYGSRGGSIGFIITFMVFYIINHLKEGNKFKLNFKVFIKLLLLIFFSLLFMQWSAVFLNRAGVPESSFDYISIYVGAEMKNLDTFLRMGIFPLHDGIWGQYTFGKLISNLANIFNWALPQITNIYGYQMVNNYDLGNVYTTFVPWLCDFGYKGIYWLTFLMALLSQISYELAMKVNRSYVTIWKLLYGTISSGILLSFFSNRFYEQINTSLVYYLIIWYIIRHFIFLKYKNERIVEDE